MIDLADVSRHTHLYNFHTHTQFCDGHAPMEDFVISAIKAGFTHLGFSPHSPVNIESNCNMKPENVEPYLAEVQRLRNSFGDRIRLFASMEIDYTDEMGPSAKYYDSIPLDYRIGSVHFIPAFDNPAEYVDIDGHIDSFTQKMHRYFADDIEAVVRSYFAQSVKMVEAGGFQVIGHFDKIGLNASLFSPGIDQQPWYHRLVTNLFEAIMDHRLIVEINTKAWERSRRFFPHARYFAMMKKCGTPLLVNSDAHNPALINAGREAAFDLLGKA